LSVSFYIAKRYLRSKSSTNAINIMTLIASAGIVIASAALFIVLSGFAGLKTFSLSFSSFVDPDLKVMPAQGKTFSLDNNTLNKIEAIDGVATISKIVEERVVISVDNKNVLATLKGVDSNYDKVTGIKEMVAQGSWLENNSLQVVSGWGISNELSFGVLDFSRRLEIYVPKPGSGQITSVKGAFNSINVVNVGLFDINEEMNQRYIFADITTAKILLNYSEETFSAVEVKFQPNADETYLREGISEIITTPVVIKNRVQLNDALYKMLNTENLAVYLIFTLVIIIALFNVIGAIIMMILDKKKSLNTLFNLGANASSIKRIFFIQGSLMTLISGIIGLVLGLIIVWLQQTFKMVMITPSLPYPVEIKVWNLVIVLLTITILGLIAAKIASARINKKLLQSL
jgi:lipoprotein-releasing system permease protein